MTLSVMAEGEDNMKKDIHPETMVCTVTCACGETFKVKSTKASHKLRRG